ncbi:serine--tRNA ligase [archaeon]|nr:serine--tRNA ligase [archaeon]|tara:strand:+ start:2863 stop:4179 length:1317 start_codon:yes stop_codon:yes gene_type:complete
MLDINTIRNSPELVKKSLEKRKDTEKLTWLKDLLRKDKESSKLKKEIDDLRHERNVISKKINELKKQNKSATTEINKAKQLPRQIQLAEEKYTQIQEKIKHYLMRIPNILHKDVKYGKDETANIVRKKVGTIPKFSFPIKNHVELLESLNLIDFDASAKVSGNGFYYLKGELGLLNQALIKFTIESLQKKKYEYIEPPLMVNKKVVEAAGDLTAFETALYKVEDEDAYMIPTAEHAILGMLTNKTILEEDLPLKYFGYSMCFRKEIGSHGINEKGLWRTHQFNKIEQFIFSHPKNSWKYYDELRNNTEDLMRKLKLPYRVLEMCTGDLGIWKARSEDIEVYRPTTKEYGEVASLSNCTDFQTRSLNIKGKNKQGKKYVLHSLNNTAIATSRILVAIIENYQQKDGSIKVPTVLQKYMDGIKKIGSEDAKNKRSRKNSK